MNALSTKFSSANLPSVADLAKLGTSLRKVDTGDNAGGTLLKMDKTGQWVYGANETPVEEGSLWAVNPLSFTHGYIAWGKKEVLGETMVPITSPMPEKGETPECNDPKYKGWQVNLGVQFACTSGEDKGLNVLYQTTSVGGKKAIQALCLAVAEQIEKDPVNFVPVVSLDSESYKHKEYGKIFAPLIDIDSWMDMNGASKISAEGEDDDGNDYADEPAEEPVVEPVKTRRRPAAVPQEIVEADDEIEEAVKTVEATADNGRRRRRPA